MANHRMRILLGAAALTLGTSTVTAQAPAVASHQPAPTAPTFTRDIVPVLQQKCQVCHRPGSIAPMSLLTYEDVKRYAARIKQRVAAREMPPWHIDRTVGIQDFKN